MPKFSFIFYYVDCTHLSFANIIVEINIKALPTNNLNDIASFKSNIPKNTLVIGSKVPNIEEDDTPINFIAFKSRIIDNIVEITEIPKRHIVILRLKFKIIECLKMPQKRVPIVEPKQRYMVIILLSKDLINFKLRAINVRP